MTARRPTRNDVARLAGTSTAVVSYVVNNGPRGVAEQTRQRVLAAMASLGYHPNALARSLSVTETRTIGMIVPNISNAYFAELALAVENEAASRGKLLFLGNSNESRGREIAYLETFIQRRVDGIVVIGVAQSSTIEMAKRAGIPVVVVDRQLDDPEVLTVSIDHRRAALAATRHLLEHGHSRIACIAGPKGQAVAEDRRQGWAEALAGARLDASDDLVFRGAFSLVGGRAAAAGFLEALARGAVTAAFVSSDDQARGLIAAAQDRGIRVPEDFALVSIDGTHEGTQCSPRLTTVRQPFAKLAQAAIAAVVDDAATSGHVHIPFQFDVGRSCGCAAIAEDGR